MYQDPSSIIDRRRLKRRLNFWRVFAVLAVVAAIAAGFSRFDDDGFRDYVARLHIDGLIVDRVEIDRLLKFGKYAVQAV